jgi:hypothetical protein
MIEPITICFSGACRVTGVSLGGFACSLYSLTLSRGTAEALAKGLQEFLKQPKERSALMHYRNGRVANNGDKVIQLSSGGECKITGFGLLHDATPGNDYCNGALAPLQPAIQGACLCDCLYVDDVVELLKNAGLGTRPKGK